MKKITSGPSDMYYLGMAIFLVLGASAFIPDSPNPVWAGLVCTGLAALLLFAAAKVEVTEEKITKKFLITGRQVSILLEELERVDVALLPHSMATLIGLMRRKKIMTIRDVHGRKLSLSESGTRRFKEILKFLESEYTEKVNNKTNS